MARKNQANPGRTIGGTLPAGVNAAGDNRAEVRVPVHKMVRIRLAGEGPVAGAAVRPAAFSGCMTEVSPAGVGLLLGRAVQTGTRFELTVRDAEGVVTELLYRAVRCEPTPRGHFQVGAELVQVLRPTVGVPQAAADVQRILASRLAG